MPVWEVVIKGKFVTGTTIDDKEQAKETCKKLLEDKLVEAGIVGKEVHGPFHWIPESVEAEKL